MSVRILKYKLKAKRFLRSSKNAFIMQSKSTFLKFIVTILSPPPPPKPENYSGARFSAHTTWKQKTLPSCRLSVKFSLLVQRRKPAHRRKRKRSPNAHWIEIVWEDRPVLDAKSVLRESVLDNRLLVCMIFLKCKHKRCLFCPDARWRVFVTWLGQSFIMFTITTLKHLGF